MRVIVVGMNPSNTDNRFHFKNPTVRKTNKWMSDCGVQYFSWANTFNKKGTPRESKVDKEQLKSLIEPYDRVVALGSFSSTVIEKLGVNHFKMPHPSPLNRQLNDKSYEADMVKACKAYIEQGSSL